MLVICIYWYFIVVLYGCVTWSLMLREEHRQKAFENKVRRRMFGPKRGEVVGCWRKLYNEELHNLYSLLNRIRIIKSLVSSANIMGIDEVFSVGRRSFV
jgi:hypothetical protein